MKFPVWPLALFLAGGVAPPRPPEIASASARANLVLVNGKVITVDPQDRVAQAVAVWGGRIVAVGSDADVKGWIGSNTRVVDLRGRTATPGLIDSHSHFDGTEMLFELDLSYPTVKSVADIVAKVRERAATAKPGEWIRGRGWDEGKLAEKRHLLAADLDAGAPDHPVYLTHTMGHYATANSRALSLAKVGRDTSDPPAGTIDRLPDGRPSGVLKEAAMGLVAGLVPEYTEEQRRRGLVEIVARHNREGMTAVKDPGIFAGEWERYRRLRAEEKLTVRVFALWRLRPKTVEGARELLDQIRAFTNPRDPKKDPVLVSGGIKLAMDGSGGARTAWLHGDWSREYTGRDAGNRGYPVTDPDAMRQIVRLFHEASVHVSTHAIGDRALDWTVDGYEDALRRKTVRGLRHGLIHANIPTDHAIEVMARLQKEYDAGYPEAQSTFTWWIGDTYAGNFGPERSRRLKPFQTYLRRGILWAGGSDFPVTPFPARYGLWASIVRRPVLGVYGADPFGQAESIDVRTALRSYTIWAARQLFLEDRIGSLEVGKEADIAVWDRDLYTIPAEEIRDLKCEMTVFAGRVVHEAGAGSAP
jgi:predicted amidohydrolase YtcJ